MSPDRTRDDIANLPLWSSLPPAFSALEELENALRCDICKDIYTSPVITTCSHTFCSLCIRRCLAAEGRCPCCRASEQESRLRKNGAIMEVVDSFIDAKKSLLEAARQLSEKKQDKARVPTEPRAMREQGKRKRDPVCDDPSVEPPSRRLRTRRKVEAWQNGTTAGVAMVIDSDNDRDPDFTPASSAQRPQQLEDSPNDGLVACPICSRRMKEVNVSSHLDTSCPGPSFAQQDSPPRPRKASQTKPSSTFQSSTRKKPTDPPPERLPQLSYALFNDAKLKKKLQDLGIPSGGSRQLLQRRHAEWLAIWNANCDAREPKSKRALMQELGAWERSQGGRSANGGEPSKSEIMQKDFDASGWARKNKGDFDELIRKARESRSKARENQQNGDNDPEEAKETADEPADRADASTTDPQPHSLTEPSPPEPIARPLTAPPSTDAIPSSGLDSTSANVNPSERHIPSLTKTISVPEPQGIPIRGLLNKRNPDPPAAASLMWTHSSSSAEVQNNASATSRPPGATMTTFNLPGINVSPAQRDAMGGTRNRRGSLVHNTGDLAGLERKPSGSGDPETPTKVPMFAVPSRPVSDGDGTGVT